MKENKTFIYQANVLGMKCGMCESHINTAIRNKFKIKKVTSSHKKSIIKIISFEEIKEDDLKALITNLGYTINQIEKLDE